MADILIVLTSHTALGETGRPTGFYYEELAVPYWALVDAGHRVTLASIQGGAAAHDPTSLDAEPSKRPAAVQRFLDAPEAMAALANTAAISDIDPAAYDAIFLPGGHGTAFDFPQSTALAKAVSAIHAAGGVVAAVCHGPAGLVNATRADGTPLVAGLRVNSFTNAEEEAVGLTDVVPFLLETRFRELGAHFEAGADFTETAIRDGRLITGQNPMSSAAVATLLLDALTETRAAA
ncbi:type 1 glutamine amidotransferase domain-containing protein [Dinoroseobacter sp. S124A]|uniref:type 1 glutamine amidotransferase domain-containing protein n=1 Tax=Dinoroseobacter sp. S124A TaxID=3415128 RepID=UPI003C79E7AA